MKVQCERAFAIAIRLVGLAAFAVVAANCGGTTLSPASESAGPTSTRNPVAGETSQPPETRVPATIAAIPATTVAPAPSTVAADPNSPPLIDVAEAIAFEEQDLTNVVVTDIAPASGSWIAASGTAAFAEDMFFDLSREDTANRCGTTVEQLNTLDRVTAYEPGPTAGTEGTFTFELVIEPAAARESDRVEADRVTTNGWYSGSYSGGNVAGVDGFVADGINANDLTVYGGNGGDSLLVGSDEFTAYCEQAA